MNFSEGRLGRAFLRFAAPFTKLRAFPVIGPGLRWASAKLLPRDTLTWVQVQRGPAQGIWLHLNPRTGRDYFNGDVEPEVQAVLGKYLRPGMTVYDIGANIGFFSLLAARLVGAAGRVTAFEADPEIAARLRENVVRNQGAPISVEEKAVWSSSSPVFFARADAECRRIAVWDTLSTMTRKDRRPARSESKLYRWTNMCVNPQRRISSSVMWKAQK